MNKKVIVIGDIHGRNIWKIIVENNPDADLYIFLGDYFTSRENINVEDQINNWEEILEFKRNNPDKVILLRGNHDIEALKKYYWAECYPKFYSDYFRIVDNFNIFINNTQWCYEINNVVFSHAGISKTWFTNVQEKYSFVQTFSDINNLEPTDLFGFTPESYSDNYGYSKTQPLVWIRPFTLAEDMFDNKVYVVGHTRQPNNEIYEINFNSVNTVNENQDYEITENPESRIICCDTLPNMYLIFKFSDNVTIYNSVKI